MSNSYLSFRQHRAHAALRPLTLLNAVLLTTAFAAPAFAQIETVVVTAERKAEDIQTTPIAVTALTGQDLKARQVQNPRDLQFHVPSVTYTKSNFGGAQFQIRGITTQFGLGAAIAQNLDDIYLEAPPLVTGEFYDVDRVEIARGPQSTSYGRAATGGAVNVVTTKPDLDNFAARASIDYGSFNTLRPDAMVNIPIIDGELGVRLAIHGDFHDGYQRNIYSGPQIYPGTPPNSHINSLGTVSGRGSIRWQPDADTTVDFVADVGYENDRRVRGDKQECHRDPSGVIGCLPDQLGFQAPNNDATLATVLGSAQGVGAALQPSLLPLAEAGIFTGGVPQSGIAAYDVSSAVAQAVGNTTGLGKVAGNGGPGDPAGPAGAAFLGASIIGVPQTPQLVNGVGTNATGFVPADLMTANTAFNPKTKGSNGTYLVNWAQTITDWLKSTLDVGYVNGYQFTQEDYSGSNPENISSLITPAVNGFNLLFGPALGPANGFGHSAAVIGQYDSAYFNVPGALPLSNVHYNPSKYMNYGGSIDTTQGGILTKTPFNTAYDEDWFGFREWTGELRLSTNFDGPLNFTAGAFYMSYNAWNQYWVAAPGLDWESAVLGAASTLPGATQGLMLGLPTFVAEYRDNGIISRSAFLEGTYDIIPDTLKVIAGARFNDDRERLLRTPTAVGGGLLTTGLFPIGDTGVTLPVDVNLPSCALVPNKPGCPAHDPRVTTTDLWTGRVSINYTPKLDFTDQTLVYLTASRGELAGGLNVPNNGAPSVVSPIFKPATVDALELGTKNTLLDGTVTANLTAWYYNYENYQVGIIANRQALTLNVPARLFGLENEFVWQPTEELAFNFQLSLTQSEAGHVFLQDQRNPTNDVPNSILIKDLVNGSNCVIVPITPAAAGHTPGESSAFHVANFYLPNGGNAAIDAPFGIPLVNYGLCEPTIGTPATTSVRAALQASGFDYAPAVNPRTGGTVVSPILDTSIGGNILRDGNGFARDLHGDQLPQVPVGQVGIGAQYTWKVGTGYTLIPRVDYYWQSSMQSRLWNDANVDRIGAWDTMNAQITLNAPDNKWYAQLFAKNVFDKKNPTGVYLTDPTSALFTNVFAEDPRVIGISLGTSW